MANPYCEPLGIPVPRLEDVKDHTAANTYALLIVSLLERGEAMTLEAVARRFEQAGVAPADEAMRSLKRCRPGRAPVHRTGDLYALDPYHHESGLWAFRLGLRPPATAPISVLREPPTPIPGLETPLAVWELDEAWRDAYLYLSPWSAQRLAMCVLDAIGSPQPPEAVMAAVSQRAKQHLLRADAAQHWRHGAPVSVRDDGRWALDRDHRHLRAARKAVRDRIEANRRQAAAGGDPVIIAARRRAWERRNQEHVHQLAGLRRALAHGIFVADTGAVALVDINDGRLETYVGDELDAARHALEARDYIAGVDVRATLAAMGFDPGARRLGELGPPQKTMAVTGRRAPLKITVPVLIRSSCRIPRPLGDPRKMRELLRHGQHAQLRQRLSKDAAALHAYYQYGHLHHAVRVRQGGIDEMLLAPWADPYEPSLRTMMRSALETKSLMRVEFGAAPAGDPPLNRWTYCRVLEDHHGPFLLDLDTLEALDEEDVQAAKVIEPGGSTGGHFDD